MTAVGIIPARMASSRFPGKPLAKIHGLPMIEHVYKRCAMATRLREVWIATCDREIMEAAAGFGGRAVMTADTHERCTDRVAEAVGAIGVGADLVVNIQGDEPMVMPEQVDDVVAAMEADEACLAANLAVPILTDDEHRNPNFVKLVVDRSGHALYYSREPIPSRWKGPPAAPIYRQTGIIGFRRDFLLRFNRLEPTALEQVESVDMLRAVEHGYRVRVIVSQAPLYTVDTEPERRRVEAAMQGDRYLPRYRHAAAGAGR